MALLTPKPETASTPTVPPLSGPELIDKQSLSTLRHRRGPISWPMHPLYHPQQGGRTPTVAKNSAASKVQIHDEPDEDIYEDFQPGAESSPTLSWRNTYKSSMGSSIRTSTNFRRPGRPSVDFPHDEEDVLVGRGWDGCHSAEDLLPARSSYDGQR